MQAVQNSILYSILISIPILKVSTKLIYFFSDDSDTEEAPEIKMSEKKPSREQICRDNLDQGMKVIFDYIKENVDSADNSLSIIMSLYDDILKVIYQGVLTTVWIRLSKLLHSFVKPVLITTFLRKKILEKIIHIPYFLE